MTIARLIQGRSVQLIQCTANTLVRDAVALLANKRIGALPVIDGETLCGIFSERDVIHQLHDLGPPMLDRPVSETMSASPITVSPETSVLDALALMTLRRVRHLPVVHKGKMIDFISIGDLVKFRIDHIQSEAEALRNFIQMA